MKRIGGLLIALLGAALLVVAALGQWTALGDFRTYSVRDWEKFDPETVPRWRSMTDLQAEADQHLPENPSEPDVMTILQETIAKRFTDGEGVHNVFSNWIQWALGQVHPAFLHVWSPELLVAKGQSMHCDQVSYLLMTLASQRGILTRHVGLGGHVVMEAWYADDWHLFDPDMEVIPLGSDGDVLSVDEVARDETALKKYFGRYPEMLGIVGSREDNTFVSLPVGARFDWKGNLLAYLEKITELLKFVIPLVMIGVGVWMLLPRGRCPRSHS